MIMWCLEQWETNHPGDMVLVAGTSTKCSPANGYKNIWHNLGNHGGCTGVLDDVPYP